MKIIDYVLGSLTVVNPDGASSATATNCTVVPGPGNIAAGNFPNALDFSKTGRLQVALNAAQITTSKFSVRCVFKVDTPVTARQNLVESNCLPFSMFLDKAGGTNDFKVAVSVNPKTYGWSGTTTEFFRDLKLGVWYTADLAYDTDTVAVFIDGVILSVHAYPFGLIEKFTGNQLFIGTWVDGLRNQFNGKMAAVQLLVDEITPELERQLDERRSHPEWFITYKQESIKNVLNLGNPQSKYAYDNAAAAYVQMFDPGLIMYNESVGAAFEMHGEIFQYYRKLVNKAELGYLVSDEGNSTKAGGRKNVFSKGGIYWSSQTGAVHVSGQLYLDYEQFGESAFIGWPISVALSISDGKEQVFQGARMYYKNGAAKAFEVHGSILAKFLATGGVNTWGYPVSNESDVKNGATLLGKSSEFERCVIYWSGGTGAFEIHGDIRQKYKDLNGPIGPLGFPTSDEGNIPEASGGGRYNTFQNGSILWFGGWNNMFVCQAFTVFLGRVDSKESEGAFMGQNDLYMRVTLDDNGSQIFSQRYPNSGDFGGHNVVDVNAHLSRVIVPNRADQKITFKVDVWESDGGAPFGGGDDHLGIYSKTLSMANAWGMTENNGIINSGSFSSINSITWSVQPQVNPTTLTTVQKWWGVRNQGTATLSYAQYAAAFRDVDSEAEWWDLTDWLEKAFYELVTKGLAANGNCFGMSLEAIYAYKYRSLFSLPLDRFIDWNTVVNEFNIKHQYQVGAAGIWWFVGQFLSGNTHNPVDVFNATRAEFSTGCHPVICISQNWNFSGKPHCILPVGWDSGSKPWKIAICDPNWPGQVRTLLVDPDKNEFSYDGSNKYSGGEWSGGRFHYMPYSVTNEQPRTPIWDAIALLLSGTIIILGSDIETVNLVDENGNDLDAFGADSIARLKQKKPLDNKFVSIKGFDATGINATTGATIGLNPGVVMQVTKPRGVIASEMFMRSEKESQFVRLGTDVFTGARTGSFTVGDALANKAMASQLGALSSNQVLLSRIRDRAVSHVANDTALMASLDPAVSAALAILTTSTGIGRNFTHRLRGINSGQLIYAIKNKLNEFRLQSTIQTDETNSVESQNLGTSSSVLKFVTSQDKTVKLEINNKMGVGKDNLKIVIDKIPAAIGKELNFNIKPGLAGLDILTTAQKVNAQVSIQATISGKTYNRNFGVDIEGGIRLRPSTVLTNNELKIGKIDTLFGQLRNPKMVRGS